MRTPHLSTQRGITFIETVIGIALFSMVALMLYSTYQRVYVTVRASQARVVAVGPSGSGASEPSNTFDFQSVVTPPVPCTFALSAVSQAAVAGGGTSSVTVTANDGRGGTGSAWRRTTSGCSPT